MSGKGNGETNPEEKGCWRGDQEGGGRFGDSQFGSERQEPAVLTRSVGTARVIG